MGNSGRPMSVPAWARTIGETKDQGREIRAICDARTDQRPPECPGFWDIDLDALIEIKGRDYSLVGRRTRCKTPGCTGWVKFYYLMGVYRPLWTDDDVARWIGVS